MLIREGFHYLLKTKEELLEKGLYKKSEQFNLCWEGTYSKRLIFEGTMMDLLGKVNRLDAVHSEKGLLVFSSRIFSVDVVKCCIEEELLEEAFK